MKVIYSTPDYSQFAKINRKWKMHQEKALLSIENALNEKHIPPDHFGKKLLRFIKNNWQAIVMFILFCIALFIINPAEAHAYDDSHNYNDAQIANAIRKAEGVWTYGIKSIKCTTEEGCRKICLRTIKNNKKRYQEYGYKQYPSFIQFLGSRYCPTEGRNLTASERRLNKNWVRNVNYWLKAGA